MSRFRLRYLATDLELPKGEFVIGRSRDCNLALDDALVSRRHVTLHVTEESVILEDLGSRNGVLLNGEKVAAKRPLRHLDRLSIGTQEMLILELGRATDPPELPFPCHQCGTKLASDDRFCRKCGSLALGPHAPTTTLEVEKYTDEDVVAFDADQHTEVTRRAVGINLVAAIVEKSLALGRFEEAERIVEKHLYNILQLAMKGSTPPVEILRRATSYAMALADGLDRARWIDWIFQTHAAAQVLLPSATVDQLHQLVRKIRYQDVRALRDYLAVISKDRDGLSAAEKFVLKRLESLERVISA